MDGATNSIYHKLSAFARIWYLNQKATGLYETACKNVYFSVTVIELLTSHESILFIAFMVSDQAEAIKELSCNKLGS
jgi:hypothetical protein